MKKTILLITSLIAVNIWGQNPPPPPPLDNGSDYDGYPYDGYYYAGGYYGYGGHAGRGRDWNNYSDGRYQDRGNHRGADRARGGGGRR